MEPSPCSYVSLLVGVVAQKAAEEFGFIGISRHGVVQGKSFGLNLAFRRFPCRRSGLCNSMFCSVPADEMKWGESIGEHSIGMSGIFILDVSYTVHYY